MIRMRLDRVEPYVYQWDTQQYVNIIDLDRTLIAFAAIKGDDWAINIGPIAPTIAKFKIPDTLLTKKGTLVVYLVNNFGEQNTTVAVQEFRIKERPQPDGYVQSEEDKLFWEELDERLVILEGKWFNLDPTLSVPGEAADARKVKEALEEDWRKTKQLVADHNTSLGAHRDIRDKLEAIKVPTKLSQLESDERHRLIADTERTYWNNKSDFSGSYTDLTNIPDDLAKKSEVTSEIVKTIAAHNIDGTAHDDIRQLINGINQRLDAFFDSDEKTLDQLSEIVKYITDNKSLIDSITTSKINVEDIAKDLTTNSDSKVLAASQGVILKNIVDELRTGVYKKIAQVEEKIPTKLSSLAEDEKSCHVTPKLRDEWNIMKTSKLDKAGGQMTGTLDMNGQKITNLPEGKENSDPIIVSQLNSVHDELAKFYTPKGKVKLYSDLPKTSQQNGDYYYVTDSEAIGLKIYPAQHVYAWINNEWLDMGERISVDETFTLPGRAADAVKTLEKVTIVDQKTIKNKEDIATINERLNQTRFVEDLFASALGTSQTVTKDSRGNISKIVHKGSNREVLRTDTFVFFENNITEERTLTTGQKMIIMMDLSTFNTSVEWKLK